MDLSEGGCLGFARGASYKREGGLYHFKVISSREGWWAKINYRREKSGNQIENGKRRDTRPKKKKISQKRSTVIADGTSNTKRIDGRGVQGGGEREGKKRFHL